MHIIRSRSNQRIKTFIKIRDGMARGNFFVVEGEKLLKEVLNSPHEVVEVFVLQKKEGNISKILPSGIPLRVVSEGVMQKLSGLHSHSPVAATCRISKKWSAMNPVFEYPWMVLDGVQDPVNVGAIFRSAEAFGCPLIVMLPGVPSPFNYKVIRASAGSSLRVKCWICRERERFFEEVKDHFLNLWILDQLSNTNLSDISDFSRSAFLLGNEGHGHSREILEGAYSTFKIPMKGKVESLNVAVAGSILLHWISNNSQLIS